MAPRIGPTIGMASAIAAMSAEQERRRDAQQEVGSAGRDADRPMRISWPRTHIPRRFSTSFQPSRARRPAVPGQERESVALEPGVLDEPEEHERQDRRDRDHRLGDASGRAGRRRPGRWRRAGAARARRASVRAVTLVPRPRGRRSAAQSRALSRNGGSPTRRRSTWVNAAGRTTSASPATTAKNTRVDEEDRGGRDRPAAGRAASR